MTRLLCALSLFLIALTSTGFAESDTTKVKVEVNRAFATIGDRINFRVTITHDRGVVVLGIDASEVLSDFETKEVTDFSTKEGDKILEGKNYVITNYKLGEYVIRPFTIQYRAEKGEVKQLKTNSLYITIESIDKDKHKDPNGDIRGVKGVRKIRSQVWSFLVAIAVVLGGIVSWFIYVEKRQRASSQDKLEPPLSPHDEAYQALNHLQHSDLIRRGQVKVYFFRMSEILRRYFERRYSIKALESTTCEVMKDLTKERLGVEDVKLIEEVLLLCDLVKFAKYDPPPVEILRQNNQAKLIIDRTKEIVVQEIVSEAVKT